MSLADRLPFTRDDLHRREATDLAPWALHAERDGRRAHEEAEHPLRTCFQRDRDRVLHSTAFRRLDFKTQVFVPHEHDHFRTRLTHTLEVAQVARTLGRALGANEDAIEAVALAHDLGHPPFGHGGEAELDALLAEHEHFEHNRQSLRIVDYLEHPYPHFRGLNLTRAVRECLARHESRYDLPEDRDEFDPDLNGPVEGQIVDFADEIAYTAADVEDAIMAGWITAEQLDRLELWRCSFRAVEEAAADARPIHKQIRATKGLLNVLGMDLLAASAERLQAPGIRTLDDVRHAGGKCIVLSSGVAGALEEMQRFLFENVYRDPRNADQEAVSRRKLRDLFAVLADDPSLLPDRYARRVERDGLERVICDYIAGMTDRFCNQQHAALCG